MSKIVLAWNDPEIRSTPEISIDDQKFATYFITKVCKLNPQFISLFGKFKTVEENGIYIGCQINTIPKFRTGFSRKLAESWEALSKYNYQDMYIHPGTFSFLLQKNDITNTVFSVYKDQNAIAMSDMLTPLRQMKENGLNKEYAKLEKLLCVMFNSSKKSFKDYEATKMSIESIMKDLEKIKMGADPEFSVVHSKNKNTMASAINILKSPEWKIGCDGHNSILELRPPASNNIDEFLVNIDSILEETSEIVDDEEFDLLTGGGQFRNESLGGHIHISNVNPTPDLLRMLDVFIGNQLRSLPGGKRPEGGSQYDAPSQYRNKSYDSGLISGFEYRTAPSFWTNEKLTKATYIIAMLVVKTYMLHKKQRKYFDYESELTYNNYKKLVDFDKYKDYIAYFYKFVSEKSPISGYVYEGWDIKKKKEKKTVRVPVKITDDLMLSEIMPEYIDVYKPPFNSLTVYGLSEKSSSLSAINIDSCYINGNVNTGLVHKWMRDFIRDVCIIDKNLKQSNIDDFVKYGNLWIGLSLPLRQNILKIDESFRKKFFKQFVKRLSVFIRDSINDLSMLDKDDKNEMIEYEKIKELINRN